jgi:hypothetical protein
MKNKPLIIACCCMLPLLLAQDEFILNAFGFGQDDAATSPAQTVQLPITASAGPGLGMNEFESFGFDGFGNLPSELVAGLPVQETDVGPDGNDVGTNRDFQEMFLQSAFNSSGNSSGNFSGTSLAANIGTPSSPGYMPSFSGHPGDFQSLLPNAPGLQAGGNPQSGLNPPKEEQPGDQPRGIDINPTPFSPVPESIYTPPVLPPGFFDVAPTAPTGQPNNGNQVASVPEPGISLLFALALVGLAISRKKLVAES